jgi:23S rRNA (pseudouridine1915-N3)-methyltransferase
MVITIIAVGTRMPDWVSSACSDYIKRMPAEMRVDLREVKPEPRSSGKPAAAMMAQEAVRIRQALPKRSVVVALDELGLDWTTQRLAKAMSDWRSQGEDVTFVIGGPDGLDASIKSSATETLRLSSMTLPHAMVRVILAEQIYRAWSILNQHPYHRT